MMPRNVLVAAVAEGAGRLPALAGPAEPGDIRIEREGDDVTVRIAGPAGPLAEARLPAPYAIDPAMLRWDGWVVYAPEGGRTVLAEAPVSVEAASARLSKGAAMTPSAGVDRGARGGSCGRCCQSRRASSRERCGWGRQRSRRRCCSAERAQPRRAGQPPLC
ncbi:hypothetical protein O0235_00615 [Tepidiforma flava]|uniref:Uncharacterized protein n=1 Tax=Tepidiforma flava TaxID=3004094 RepID=A0ABY7M6M0_9CHLR|nr:hypothetical protein [Tepidiforma flava]WBL36158.1 hypothetical protein O0235_00615 [Tepidiforma flava]